MSEQPTEQPAAAAPDFDQSIVDTILDLDALLSADVRRAEGVVYIYARADLEAHLDVLAQELADVQASGDETSLTDRNPETIRADREKIRTQYAQSRIPIPVRQMVSDDWDAFQNTHKDALAGAVTVDDLPVDVTNDLIARSLVAKTPATVAQVALMRQKFGSPQISQIAVRAWQVNEHSGVSVPK